MENREREEQNKNKKTQLDQAQEITSGNNTHKRNPTGTGTQNTDENFDNTHGQVNQVDEKYIEDRDTNDGDANNENNF